MADRRMFSRTVVESDAFLAIPPESQALYFHLGLNADDDGVVACSNSLLRLIDRTIDDLKPLIESGFVLEFPGGFYVISDWLRNNTLKKDRYTPSAHQNIMNQIQIDEKSKVYSRRSDVVPARFQSGSTLEPKERGSIDRYKIEKEIIREGSQVFSSDSHVESKNERYVDGKYRPQLWECIIPEMFWGKFETEADYYSYAEEHRDEIIKMIEEMEEQEKRDGKS